MESPIILTSSKVLSNQQGLSESNIIVNNECENECEADGGCDGDGACPPPLFPLREIKDIGYKWRTIQGLHYRELNTSKKIVFDPLGRTPLAVINLPAFQILESFKKPRLVNDLPTIINGLKSEDIKFTANQLIALGFLRLSDNDELFALPPKNTPITLTAWLHLTNNCNLRCDYCYLRKNQESMSVERGRQAVDAVFRSAIAQSFRKIKLKYAGGESTLEFKLLLQIHDYAQSQAAKFGLGLTGVVLSNGIGISNSMIESLRQRNIRLTISLDGLSDFNDVQRKFENGSGSFSLVERSLERLLREKFIPSITITVSRRNIAGLPKVVEYLLERELPFTINFYRENEHSCSFEDLAYQDEQIIDGMKKAFTKIEENLPAFNILGAITDRARLDASHLQPCGVGHSYMVIDQNGNVAKCHMEIERKITDISVIDPLRVLQLDMLGIQNLSVEEKEGCKTCDWRYYCAGGCPALTHRVTGRYDIKSPNCRIYKAIFPDVLRLEGLRILKYADKLKI